MRTTCALPFKSSSSLFMSSMSFVRCLFESFGIYELISEQKTRAFGQTDLTGGFDDADNDVDASAPTTDVDVPMTRDDVDVEIDADDDNADGGDDPGEEMLEAARGRWMMRDGRGGWRRRRRRR